MSDDSIGRCSPARRDLSAEFTKPWFTYALLLVLAGLFMAENLFAVTPGQALTPSIGTLLAMGGLSRPTVLVNGEWYRIVTAPFLHGGLIHIIANGVALFLGGPHLERLIGRLWFGALLAVSAVCGSLMSLAVNPPNLVSVGASGALMGLFAALFVSSFRLPAGSRSRQTLQTDSMRVLIPSLLPIIGAGTGAHIDYGAHLGGALGGAALGAVMVWTWPKTERLPGLKPAAMGLSVIGALLVLVGAGTAIRNYRQYDVAMIPPAELPKTAAERQARAADLVKHYPGDPRSHLFMSGTLTNAGDRAGAERELRLTITIVHEHLPLFGQSLELVAEGALAEDGKREEAQDVARPLCAAPPGDKTLDSLMKLLAGQHLCDGN